MAGPISLRARRLHLPARTAVSATLVGALAGAVAIVLGGGCGPRHGASHGPEAPIAMRATSTAGANGEQGEPGAPGAPSPLPVSGRAVHMTLYHVAAQPCPDTPQVGLPKCGGGSIAMVSQAFKKSAAMQGSARLCDGRIVGVRKIHPLCFAVVDGVSWGVTASGRPASPFRSIAVDPKVFPLGRWYYVPELVGMPLPSPAAGKVHDGCVRADDVGSGVKGMAVDFFVGTYGAVEALKPHLGDGNVHLADGSDICTSPAEL